LPVIATNDVHYIEHEQHTAHDTLLCIQTQTTVNDTNRMKFGSDQFYFKQPQEMKDTFLWMPEAISNTMTTAPNAT